MDPDGNPCEFHCPGGTYVYEDGTENPNSSIFTCFWLMIITITTVGYGDISPITLQGKLVAVAAMIFGIIYTAMPLAIVGSFFFDAYDKQKKATQKPQDLNASIRTKIPKHAAPAIETFIDGSGATENLSFKGLTTKLKSDVDVMLGKPVEKKKSGLSSMLGKLGVGNADRNQDPSSQSAGPLGADNENKADEKTQKPTLLPLVLKRSKRYIGHQQQMLLEIGHVIHFMIAERQSGELGDDDADGDGHSLHHSFH